MAAGAVPLRSSPTQTLGGDRLYVVARWLLLVLIYTMALLLQRIALMPPPTPHVFGQIFWGYVAFSILAGALTLSPRSAALNPWTYLLDLLWIGALAYWSPDAPTAYTVLSLLPLGAAALRLNRAQTLALSILAVIITIGVQFKAHTTPDTITFASQAFMVGALPWLINLLSEQWAADNRQRVAIAQKDVQQSLAHAEGYRARMRALYEVAVALNTNGHPGSVLEATLNECARVLPYQTGAIVLPTGAPHEVQVIAGRALGSSELNVRFMVGNGVLGQILRGSNGGVLHNAHGEPELASLPSINGRQSVLILPLRSAQRTFGVVLFGSDAEQLNVEQMDMATTLVSYGLVALQNTQLIAELRAERDNLLAREEEVRKQLNRDLHDGPAQALAAITMTLGFIKKLHEKEPQRVPAELDKLQAVSQRANHEVRTLLFELRPLVMETQGLVATVRQYMERFEQNATPKVVLEGDDDIGPLTKRVQGTLFNIVQESVNNALKHAQAQHIWIRIHKRSGELQIKIQDDGKGFDFQSVKASYDQRGSFGLLSLEERARLIGGTAELLSAVGAGTTVSIAVPLDVLQ